MKILRGFLVVGLLSVLLYSVLIVLRHPHRAHYDSKGSFVFSKGNAPEGVRAEVLQQLQRFQDGYANRNTARLDSFMEQLFSRDDLLILGTQPTETLSGYERARALVSSDWRTWGDCTFLMDNAHISTAGDVAWVSTIGYVEFDMSRWLVLPLRLSAVMVKKSNVWKFRQMQFQFDLDVTSLLVIIILLLIWLPISLVSLVIVTVKTVRKRSTCQPTA